jgi:hypothetical protein
MNAYSHCQGSVEENTSMIVGFASMILAFSLLFVGIRNYRNKFNNGIISFGKAFKIGFFIALIASTMYVVAWYIDYTYFMPDFWKKYAVRSIETLKTAVASASELELKTKEMANTGAMYKNPFFFAMFTYMEILPVGLIVTLISSLILKKKVTGIGGY